MQPFARLLSAAYIGKEPARPLAAEALGAVLLDAAGLLPEEIERGRVIVYAAHDNGNDQALCVEATLRRVWSGRACGTDDLARLVRLQDALDGRIVLADGIHTMRPGEPWMTTVGEHSLGCAMIVAGPHEVHADVDAWKTKAVSLPATDAWPVIADAIRLATGDNFVIRAIDCRGATVSDFRASLGVKMSAREAIATLSRIVSGRKAKRLRGEAKTATEDFMADLLAADAEPLAAPVDRVIRRLSEMHGFGEAGAWGLRLAADVRDFKDGKLAWSDLDKGVLLVGPPGGGKTTFAKSLALECQVDLVTTVYGDWHEGSGDAVARTLKKLFTKWREKGAEAPFVLLVDEIDSIGRRGGNGNQEGWFVTMINNWLAFLDGPMPRPGVIVVATTNHVERVDPALCRPGRLDRVVELPYPDVSALEGIIRHHLGVDAVIDDAELAAAAKACRGRSPAAIEQLCREARSVCRRIYKRRPCAEDVTDVVRIQRLMTARHPDAERGVLVHEAGHAVVAIALGIPVQHVDADAAQAVFAAERRQHVEGDIQDDIVATLAGKAAEEVLLGWRSIGATGDVQQATVSALALHARAGLGVAGHVTLSPEMRLGDPLYDAVRATTDAAWNRALGLVRLHRANIRRVAAALGRDRYLDGAEVAALMVHPLRDLARHSAPDEPKVPDWVPSPPRRGHGWAPRLAA